MAAVNAYAQERSELQHKDEELAFAKDCLAQFTYAISHELNSPINTLTCLLDMLSDENRQQLNASGNELLDMIMLCAKRTQDTVNGILKYSKCAMPLEEKESLDTGELLTQVLSELDPLLKQSEAIVEIGNMPVFMTSRNGMKRVFHELIANALKFTYEDEKPRLSIFSQPQTSGVEFVFCDEGTGIDPTKHENIFDLFTKLHARSDFEGAGLGLSIALQVVNALDGRIWVTQTAQGRGSAFHVFLPL